MIDEQHIREDVTIPEEIQKLAGLAKADLYNGPLYLSPDGEVSSMFDESVSPFDFVEACKELSDWCGDHVSTMYYEPDSGCLSTREPESQFIDGEWYDAEPYYEVDRREVIKILFGRELAAHL